jgi:hypothetical protein
VRERLGGRRIAAVLAVILAIAGATAALAAAATFPDPVGDVEGGAGPDLTSVSVANTRTVVTFRVRFAKAPPLRVSASGRWIDMLLIGIDVPPRGLRPGIYGWSGADYAAGLHGTEKTGVMVKAPSAKAPNWTKVATFKVDTHGRTVSLSISRRKLGNPSAFDFVVTVGREVLDENAAEGGADSSPSRGIFHYRLTG